MGGKLYWLGRCKRRKARPELVFLAAEQPIGMSSTSNVLKVERDGVTIVVTPVADLRESEIKSLQDEFQAVLDILADGAVKNVVMDFEQTDYYGSTALGFFVKVWKRVRCAGGRMAFCGVSKHEQQILEITNLNTLWPIYGTRDEALAYVNGG